MDCGPTCLRIIAKYYGGNLSLQKYATIQGSTATEFHGYHVHSLNLGILLH